MIVSHKFPKAPGKAYFKNRSVSFNQDEVVNVSNEDTVIIEVHSPFAKSSKISVTMSGDEFKKGLTPKKTKDGKDFLVFRF